MSTMEGITNTPTVAFLITILTFGITECYTFSKQNNLVSRINYDCLNLIPLKSINIYLGSVLLSLTAQNVIYHINSYCVGNDIICSVQNGSKCMLII